jgi:hypothetical protein
MTKADQTVESAADKLDGFVRDARASGGVKARVAEAPSPSPAREPIPGAGPSRPRSGPSPWLVLGVALVAGYTIARAIDWRSHAHPRY